MGLFAIAMRAVRFGYTGLRLRVKNAETAMTTKDREVELPNYGKLKISLWLNFMGDTCLRTNLVTKKALINARSGDVIEVTTDNPSSMETIPYMLQDLDCVHLATIHEEQCWRVILGKNPIDRCSQALADRGDKIGNH